MSNSSVFMRLTKQGGGAVDGECEVDGYEDWIELDDWSWGVAFQQQEDDGKDQAVPTKFSFNKAPDRSSTVLMSHLNTSKPFAKADIRLVDWKHSRFELRAELTNLRMVSLSFSGQLADASADLDEHWECDFNTVTFSHFMGNDKGQKVPRTTSFTRPPNASLNSPRKAKPKKDEDDEQDDGKDKAGKSDTGKHSGQKKT